MMFVIGGRKVGDDQTARCRQWMKETAALHRQGCIGRRFQVVNEKRLARPRARNDGVAESFDGRLLRADSRRTAGQQNQGQPD